MTIHLNERLLFWTAAASVVLLSVSIAFVGFSSEALRFAGIPFETYIDWRILVGFYTALSAALSDDKGGAE